MNDFLARVKEAEENFAKTEDGRVILPVEIGEGAAVFSDISFPGKPMLSAEVGEFIENAAKGFDADENFLLKVRGKFSPEEKEKFSEAKDEFFIGRYVAAARELRRNRFRLAWLFAVGVFILGSSYFFKRELWSEVGNIAAWVLIWRMVDIIAFDNRELKADKKRARAFAEMAIEFEE